MDKIGDEFVMDPNCIVKQTGLAARSFQSLSAGTSYLDQNGGGPMMMREHHHHHRHRQPVMVNSAALVESHFLSPASPMDSSSCSRHQQHPLNGSATKAPAIAQPDVDDLMNDDSDSVSQSSRPGKSIYLLSTQ